MKFNCKSLPAIFSVISLTFFVACGQGNSGKNVAQTDNLTTPGHELIIDTFSTFPPEIEGCSCNFSNNPEEFKKGEYIYINDYADISFLKINGILTRFTQTDFTNVDSTTTIVKAKSEPYELIIEVKEGKQSGEESSFKSGTIKLTDKHNKTVTKTFFGECGC